jgi:hypothetical protein
MIIGSVANAVKRSDGYFPPEKFAGHPLKKGVELIGYEWVGKDIGFPGEAKIGAPGSVERVPFNSRR